MLGSFKKNDIDYRFSSRWSCKLDEFRYTSILLPGNQWRNNECMMCHVCWLLILVNQYAYRCRGSRAAASPPSRFEMYCLQCLSYVRPRQGHLGKKYESTFREILIYIISSSNFSFSRETHSWINFIRTIHQMNTIKRMRSDWLLSRFQECWDLRVLCGWRILLIHDSRKQTAMYLIHGYDRIW